MHDDAKAFYHWAHNYVPNEADRKNFAYDSKRAVSVFRRTAFAGFDLVIQTLASDGLLSSSPRQPPPPSNPCVFVSCEDAMTYAIHASKNGQSASLSHQSCCCR